ncbi:MAG: recombination mediator RecR [Elusimicrobiota bacterium]|nr:recombination mediator RecR [Endomicrobiia bacterium]MCX7910635.1 recombination mediator RecR [Endomicrobiia bacterium]MDW8165187.1 recombination mediator RecR [Elusimicrobiota bacterium]
MEKPKFINELISIFKSFPSVGPKAAERFTYFLLDNRNLLSSFVKVLTEIENNIVRCKYCNNFSSENPCHICTDTKRNNKLLCVVEKYQDIYSIEKTEYNGLYYVLGAVINPLEGKMPKDIDIEALYRRIVEVEKEYIPDEVIIALGFTTESEITSNFIIEYLKSKNIKIKFSRIAKGLPVGADIEYSDPQTLSFAFKNRILL